MVISRVFQRERAEEARALLAECLWLRGGRNMARDLQGRQWGYMP